MAKERIDEGTLVKSKYAAFSSTCIRGKVRGATLSKTRELR